MLPMPVGTLLVSLVAVHCPLRRECVAKAKSRSGGRSDKPNIRSEDSLVGKTGHSQGCISRPAKEKANSPNQIIG